MRILWHMPALHEYGDGLSMRAFALAAALARHGHAVTFCASAARIFVTGTSVRGFPIVRLPEPNARRPLHWSLQGTERARAARSLVAQIDEPHDMFISCQAEVVSAYRARSGETAVIFVCGSSTLLFDGADCADQGRLGRIQRVFHALDRGIKRRNESAACRAADRVVFDSRHTRERIERHYRVRGDRLITVEGGVDPAIFAPPTPRQRKVARERLGIQDDAIVVMGSGRLVERKGFAILIRALMQLDGRFSGLIVGDGPGRTTLENLARSEPRGAAIRFFGMTDDVASCLHAADVYAFTSLCESFGAALVEAMACALPCVALRPDGRHVVNANAEILEDGVSGLLCRPDADDLARTLANLADDPTRCASLGEAARRRILERYTWTRAGVGIAALVEEMEARICAPRAVMALQG